MAEQQRFASMNPDTFAEGGGLLDDADVTISAAVYTMTDYDGAVSEEQPVAMVTFNVDGEEHKQYYSVGDRKKFAPSADGKRIILIGTAEKFTKKSKWAMLLTSMVNAGFPKSELEDGDITAIISTGGHVTRVAYDDKGLDSTKKKGKDSTVLVFDKIDKLPGEDKGNGKGKGKQSGKPAGKTSGEAAAPAAATASDDVKEEASNLLVAILGENGGQIKQASLILAASKNEGLKNSKNRKEIIKLFSGDDFVGAADMPWSVADGVISL